MRVFPVHHSRVLTCPSVRSGQLEPASAQRWGAAAVEFAIISPLLFMLALGSIEFGRGFMAMELLNNAARTGCRKGVLSGSATKDINTAVNTALANSAIPSNTASTAVLVNGVSADANTAVRGDSITVTVSVPFNTISWLPNPLFLGGDTLSTGVVMRRE